MTALRKNNTGLDAKQLFVGTSGVFGVVTRAVLRVVPRPAQRATALVGAADGAHRAAPAVAPGAAPRRRPHRLRGDERRRRSAPCSATSRGCATRSGPRCRRTRCWSSWPPRCPRSRLALDELLESHAGRRCSRTRRRRGHHRHLSRQARRPLGHPPSRLREPPPRGRGAGLRHQRARAPRWPPSWKPRASSSRRSTRSCACATSATGATAACT